MLEAISAFCWEGVNYGTERVLEFHGFRRFQAILKGFFKKKTFDCSVILALQVSHGGSRARRKA